MPMRLVALDEGPDIPVDRAMVVVGRHPQCDARIDSIRVSRRHCCMTADHGEVVVRDLGSTNGIRINGQRVEMGRLKSGDELSIAHIRYRLDVGPDPELTLADGGQSIAQRSPIAHLAHEPSPKNGGAAADPLLAAVRPYLPANVPERCRIQVIVQMQPELPDTDEDEQQAPAEVQECRPDSSP